MNPFVHLLSLERPYEKVKSPIIQNAMFNSFYEDAAPRVSTSRVRHPERSEEIASSLVVDHCGLLRLCIYEWRTMNPEFL